jgi:aryl-alcohol dehydrogenase-like predicted oxidoreductase
VSNQVNYSLLHRSPEENGVLDACRELGVTLIAYTPLASGALTGKYRPGGQRPTGVRRFMPAFRKLEQVMPVVEELERIGREHDRSAAQVALNWLARQDSVLPIPGAKDGRQASENARSIDFEITKDEAAKLDEVSRSWKQ